MGPPATTRLPIVFPPVTSAKRNIGHTCKWTLPVTAENRAKKAQKKHLNIPAKICKAHCSKHFSTALRIRRNGRAARQPEEDDAGANGDLVRLRRFQLFPLFRFFTCFPFCLFVSFSFSLFGPFCLFSPKAERTLSSYLGLKQTKLEAGKWIWYGVV